GHVIWFDYDHDLLRVKQNTIVEGGRSETRYLYDGQVTLVEYRPTGQTTTKYNYGNDLLTWVDATQSGRPSQFYSLDGLGSTVTLTDQSGNVQASYRYDVWGNIRREAGHSVNRKTYTGHYSDDETGLQYFGARYYDSSIGLFITQDPYLGNSSNPT